MLGLTLFHFSAASYGILSIGLAFVVGRLGTVLQASIAISGSIRGPLLALFVLAFFFPSCNWKGGVFGTICGISCSFFIAVMTIIYPRPQTSLPVYTDGCSNSTFQAYGSHNRTTPMLPWEYHPEYVFEICILYIYTIYVYYIFILYIYTVYVYYLCILFHFHLYNIFTHKIFLHRGIKSVIHISYFYISGLGFFVTIVAGLLIGLVSGGRKQPVDGRYMSEYRVPGNNVFMSKAVERDEDEIVGEPLMQKSIGGTTLESLERPRRGEPIRVPVQE